MLHFLKPDVDFWSVRKVTRHSETLTVRQGVLEPPYQGWDEGVYVCVLNRGGAGYACVPDSSQAGLRSAFERAKSWAEVAASQGLFRPDCMTQSAELGIYQTPIRKPWHQASLSDRIDLLLQASQKLKHDARVIDWMTQFSYVRSTQRFESSLGAQIVQEFDYFDPALSATAHHNSKTQTRTLAGHGVARQAGLELLEELDWLHSANRVAEEALELVMAENCPTGVLDLLLAPDQMMLQTHESIGHPLELDRILGDERNYAGTSFVTQEMFGSFHYGSKLLNVTFDPSQSGECASYAFDDEGSKAEKIYLIEEGVLKRPLGSALSGARTGLASVANSRACNWNRPPIDRMANLNLEPGSSSLESMIQSVEKGVYMKSNLSWSIDDSRNKFQFGCEWAQLIENGRLTRVVRNPNYRGISSSFWQNLAMVGDQQTRGMYGTPTCGKGEPNQAIRVGHASPACLFSGIDVFGGQE
ncbi:MAG: TldD/PmbA family protein [Myxococcaceae bacterium]|nr:TldD/PmbA family protein [Myxococcaceae bacterium]MBH2006022.1 TldD/PmbA family protein [Myxococcaceae bacterium]